VVGPTVSGTGDVYICAGCGSPHEKGRSDEEAMAEARAMFSPAEREGMVIVCDDCWQRIKPQLRAVAR
jgi:DNA-directed RNA polymerase subunit RPC12/RpoP